MYVIDRRCLNNAPTSLLMGVLNENREKGLAKINLIVNIN